MITQRELNVMIEEEQFGTIYQVASDLLLEIARLTADHYTLDDLQAEVAACNERWRVEVARLTAARDALGRRLETMIVRDTEGRHISQGAYNGIVGNLHALVCRLQTERDEATAKERARIANVMESRAVGWRVVSGYKDRKEAEIRDHIGSALVQEADEMRNETGAYRVSP